MADMAIIVINAKTILADLDRKYQCQMVEWKSQCLSMHSNFKKKTSRSNKNGKSYESTAWYKIKPGGGLESVGKEEPDYSKYYPPEPKPAYSFKFQKYEEHVILNIKDYEANLKLFKDCLAFNLELCRNPLIKNLKKVNGAKTLKFFDDRDLDIRPKEEIYGMLAKVTLIANTERQLGNMEHASLMTAMGVGMRWVLRDYDFGLEELTKPKIDQINSVHPEISAAAPAGDRNAGG
ncbi:MAG: hypothetical protein MPEBLZ_04510 [Candidatus Methanoperedens nitroreducens]|uniref:Uncharacterized protein n=1 Tax=Candidatus Methanoperedens nitratireducens TaxID=1392998 RepID=A0A0P8CEU4_9EURY|nr:hypothetical protein [Candidatus Methanoperedens sp. BLZ2]KAB2942397.1 MAG: hypothetical protein F9K14_17255 [Candidatus Methanoperedens sp.]KPQ40942.1 MAG: hypothetical protein MPEBLZ_04510 [Candidatus Methanoperedens sp. BLZ1]MBZ0176662.1 hypothetical protein [Candidatus Methanoperedens nitroreducens]MCX9080386.1 hypothetical protein [Candidatus Methanoperedens sp.]